MGQLAKRHFPLSVELCSNHMNKFCLFDLAFYGVNSTETKTKEMQFFTDSSLQASQQGTKTQGVTEEEEKRRIETKESDTSTTRPRYETSFDE